MESNAKPAPTQGLFSSRPLVMLLFGAAICAAVYFSTRNLNADPVEPGLPKLKTGGTSVVSVILQNRWRAAYGAEKKVEVDYESTGSTKGVENLVNGNYSIAFTHAPLSKDQMAKAEEKGGPLLQLPVLVCGVAPVYNVKELKGKAALNFTGEVLADIFLGRIETWDNEAIKKLNPGVELPKTKIVPIHREDSSGTTLLFSEYLAAASPAWKEKFPKPSSELKWPTGVGAARTLGVLTKAFETEGAIGYVDRLFTSFEEIDLPYGAVQNGDKSAYVRAEPEAMTASLASFKEIPENLAIDLANRPGKDSYPISGVIYAICYQAQPAAAQKEVADFLNWAIHKGQDYASKTRYAALSPEVVAKVEEKIKTIRAK